ncbi:nuclear transport factor 2 family protein [Prevotella merdae]|uniref:nuclear transport factor 2 family protein n=1 Tax=Prevotella merdae TaxID=2079531 RepID=UPI003F81ECFF
MNRTIINRLMLGLLVFFISLSQALATTSFKITDGEVDPNVKARMETNVKALLDAFRTAADNGEKTVKLSKDNVSKTAIEEIKEIWKSSAMSCPPMNLNCRCLKTSNGYQVRGIPVDILAADGDEARQELTINFDTEGTISNVAIAIEMNRYEELMAQKQSDLDYARRQIIVDFIENFRTAYNRKDNAMLNSVFSDKALIITGRVVKEKPNSDLTRLTLNNNRVVYIKQTKQEYLTKLAQVFKTVKFINVKFSDIEIVEHPKFDSIYGVTLKQSWRTDRYHDEGYLFLMIDFRDSDNPLIQVRTWQPYKDAAGNIVTQKDEVFHLGSFRIVR